MSLMLNASAPAHGTSHELIEAASREIAARPDDASPYLRRAFLHLEHGDWNACLLDVDDAERRQPNDPGAGLLRGRALAAGGRFAEAKAVLDKFVASHPDHAAALMQRARILGALGQKADAADEFVRAMAHVPQPEPDHVFELISFLRGAGREEDALAAIDKAPGRMRDLQSLVDRAVELEMKLGRHDAALRRMDEAIEAAKVKEPLLAKRASLLARAGRTRESIAGWKALQERILAMPPLERGSHAMSRLLEQARHAAESLASLPSQ
jgi:tetratricopeptide (TPR) repeat protein